MRNKAILLAGGQATRLYPVTRYLSKHLLPVGGHPMIAYPLGLLKSAGLTDILLISSPEHLPTFEKLIGNGRKHGIKVTYEEQAEPKGIAQALLLGEKFLNGEPSVLALGDNLYAGDQASIMLEAWRGTKHPRIFTSRVSDCTAYGMALMHEGVVSQVVEKPKSFASDFAVTGLYLLDERAPDIAKGLQPSARGELEIADLLNVYAKEGKLAGTELCAWAWYDLGTFNDMHQANKFMFGGGNRNTPVIHL